MEEEVTYQVVPIQPIECIRKAKGLISGQYWLLVGIVVLGLLVGSMVPFGIIFGPMFCGIYLCYFKLMEGEIVQFEDLFKGFDYFKESLIATLILVGVMLIVIVPLYMVMIGVVFGVAALGIEKEIIPIVMVIGGGMFYLVILLLSLISGVLFFFAYPLIVDKKMKGIPALKLSCRAAWANFGGLLALFAILLVAGMISAMFCYFPVFFVAPLSMGAMAIAYRKVFPDTA